jgi:hypothetical protein
MRFLEKTKDGGPDSPVDAYVLVEIKSLFSIMLLKFNKGHREAFHTHAFNAWTWLLAGGMREEKQGIACSYVYTRDLLPKHTPRVLNHRVHAFVDSWAFTVRGPWVDTWTEDERGKHTVLTHGRRVVDD